jgi:hypothetical protein
MDFRVAEITLLLLVIAILATGLFLLYRLPKYSHGEKNILGGCNHLLQRIGCSCIPGRQLPAEEKEP